MNTQEQKKQFQEVFKKYIHGFSEDDKVIIRTIGSSINSLLLDVSAVLRESRNDKDTHAIIKAAVNMINDMINSYVPIEDRK